jgi:plastocyanin
MNRVIAGALACCTLGLLAACGSSASPTSSHTKAGKSSAATQTQRKAGTQSSPAASLKVDTNPKFASPSPSAPIESGVVQIAYRNIAIDPDTVRVKVGSTVKWTNYDSTQANVASVNGPQRFRSKDFGEGGTFEVKLTKPGTIHYECTLYPVTMNGTIEVVG